MNINPAGGAASDLDVSTAGTLVGAFNLGDAGVSSTTIHAVPFQSFAVPFGSVSPVTVGSFTLAPGGGGTCFSTNSGGGSANPPFTTLSPNYRTLLASYVLEQGATSSMTLTMSGLSVGGQYQFQWWTNVSGQIPILTTATADGGGAVTLSSNTSPFDGTLGQYALGTFTANALTQAITFTGNGGDSPFVNAFQLRQTAAPVIPEPSSILFGLALCGVAGLRRRP